jgi:UDP-N-acetylglucosamine 2-epimerase (non-hydrolysing)
VDEPARLGELARFIDALASDNDVVFPVHPRTRRRLEDTGIGTALDGRVCLADPVGYVEFVRLLTEAALVVTDSGGVQEESAYLGVPCLTLRQTTERPITVDAGTNRLEPQCAGDLLGAAGDLMSKTYPRLGTNPVLLAARWDGAAGPRIAEQLRARSLEES